MKRVLFYLVSDLHIDDSSGELVRESLNEIFLEMVTNSISTLIVSGDIFNFRKSQTLVTLDYWELILEDAKKYNITIVAIPGNHDKASYTSERSYLELYKYHPNFTLIRDVDCLKNEDEQLDVWLIPFFDEKTTYQKYLSKVQPSENSILITHIAVNGVRNNDGSEIKDTLSIDVFKKFKYVYVGHYHDRQFIDNVVYVGSIMQRNFGEDEFKGYTKIFEDGSYEFVDKEFQVYETVKLEYSDSLSSDLEKLNKMSISDKLKVRVVLNGTKEELDSIKSLPIVKSLEENGFVVKSDYVSVDQVELESAESFTPFTKENLYVEFREFAELNNIDGEEGELVLKTLLDVQAG